MGKGQKNSPSFFSTQKLLYNPKTLIQTEKQPNSNSNPDKQIESIRSNVNKSIPVASEDQETDEEWETVSTKKSNKIGRPKPKVSSTNNTQLHQPAHQNIHSQGVHSYFLLGKTEPTIKSRSNKNRTQPPLSATETNYSIPSLMNGNINERRKIFPYHPLKSNSKINKSHPKSKF